MLMLGMILLGELSYTGAVQEIDYDAQNYYNGDYTDLYDDAPTSLAADEGYDDDDYVTAGALQLANQARRHVSHSVYRKTALPCFSGRIVIKISVGPNSNGSRLSMLGPNYVPYSTQRCK